VTCKTWVISLLVALSLGGSASGSQGAPLGSRPSLEEAGQRLERVAARRCWRQEGRRYCRGYRAQRQTSGYYEHDPDRLPFGTSRWWEEMLRENRAGNPGGGGRN